MPHKWMTAPSRRRMASRFVEALNEIGHGRILRGNDFKYRRGYGMGRDCDTTVYMLEHREMVTLLSNGRITLTSLGEAILHDHRATDQEDVIDADHS
jgi:hypothetical protein